MSATADDPLAIRRLPDPPPPDEAADAAAPEGAGFPPGLTARYRLPSLLGRGMLTATYRATDLELRRQVAIKLFPSHLAADETFRERFLEKGRVAARLDHPNIGRVFEAGVAEGRPYLVMELIDGQSLRTLLDLRGRLPLHTALSLAVQIAEALAYAHNQGVFHADLRPENVLLDRQGRPKVVDFGLCHVAVATGVVSLDSIARRAAYLAPEQVSGDSIGPRTDVYALAAMLYEMLVGAPPLSGPNALATASRRLFAEPPRLRAERPDVSWGLEYVIRQALAPDPADRPPSAEAFRAALLAPPRDSDLSAGLKQTEWAFRSALQGERGSTDRLPLPGRRRPGGWSLPSLGVLLPLLGTLVVVVVLTNLFDFLPPVLLPLQSVQAPELRNRAYAEAELIGRDSGVEVVKAHPEPCDNNARDYVLRQDPEPGTLMRRGAKVRLTTCSGIRVPSLVGQREEEARVQLVQRGWTVREVRTETTASVPPGTILAQDPSADLILPDRQPLVLTVAEAPRP
ncbi:MAG TPA: protein kinase [Chloroflexota bacterium]|nr:protein kinase [Chloroflexota bacterium]